MITPDNISRRTFLKRATTAVIALNAAPLVTFEKIASAEGEKRYPAQNEVKLQVVRMPENYRSTIEGTYYTLWNQTNPNTKYVFQVTSDQTSVADNSKVIKKIELKTDAEGKPYRHTTLLNQPTVVMEGDFTDTVPCSEVDSNQLRVNGIDCNGRTTVTAISLQQTDENGDALGDSKPATKNNVVAKDGKICFQSIPWLSREIAPVVTPTPTVEPTPTVIVPTATPTQPPCVNSGQALERC